MNDAEMEKLLEQGMSGVPPREEFREQVLLDSVLTFTRVRRTRARWRAASLAAAAVLIATVSFLLGRSSLPRAPVQTRLPGTSVASESQTVAVPNDLVAWLDAARLFRQLGMEDRMARAVDHAGKLLPCDAATAGDMTGPAVVIGGKGVQSRRDRVGLDSRARRSESAEGTKRILAQVLGD